MSVRWWVLSGVGVVWVAALLAACGTLAPEEVPVTAKVLVTSVASTLQTPTAVALQGELERAVPAATPAGSDLTTPLGETECPVTGLQEFQACDGALCVRAASMVTGVNERHKILWLPQNGFEGKLVVQAERYGGGNGLRQVLVDTLSPPEPDYPSVWQFPAAGCWRLTATAGEAVGRVVVWVR